VLAAHQYQGRSNDCAPYSLAMALNGTTSALVDGDWLARAMEGLRWHGRRPVLYRLLGAATFPWGMVAVLRSYGLDAFWQPLSSPDYLLGGLARGDILFPILGAWRPAWAHASVLLAYDPVRGWGLADPARQGRELLWRPDPEFRRLWRAYGRTVVVARRRGHAL
jgi:hypothetical protein